MAKRSKKAEQKDNTLPLMPMLSTVVYPNRVVTVHITIGENLALLNETCEPDSPKQHEVDFASC